MTDLRELLNDEEVLNDALAMLKVAIEKGDPPKKAMQMALGTVVLRLQGWRPDRSKPFHSHDERIAAVNRLFRDVVVPSLPEGEVALLIVSTAGPGLLTYIANGERAGCREMLRELLTKWDAEAT